MTASLLLLLLAMLCALGTARASAGSAECDQGDAAACLAAAELLYGDPARQAELTALLQQACTVEDPQGCLRYGWQLISRAVDWGHLAASRRQTRDAWTVSCDAGLAPGCTSLGVLEQEFPEGRKTRPKTVLGYFTQGCIGGDPRGRRLLADMRFRGDGGPLDRDGAGMLYAASCEAGEQKACTQLALMAEAGIGVAQDTERSDRL